MALSSGLKAILSSGQVSLVSQPVGSLNTTSYLTSTGSLYQTSLLAVPSSKIDAPSNLEYILIGGGGGGCSGGSSYRSGSGGAGAYRSNVAGEISGGGGSREGNLTIALSTNYALSIGAGGAGVGGSATGNRGTETTFAALGTSPYTQDWAGGGGNGQGIGTMSVSPNYPRDTSPNDRDALNSNQSWAMYGGAGSSGTSSWQFLNSGIYGRGHDSQPYPYGGSAGYGGGAGEPGWKGYYNHIETKITGSVENYCRGGADNTAASANTGDGGGGTTSTEGTGKNGGSGIAIFRYASTLTITIGAGLTGSTTTFGGYKVTKITAGSGNVSWA